ncbi:hypothetical protein [Streptomyces sp. NPDC057412]|uniref:hypothetical protein n=1 Tax=Streptomyces sp. NPDC057412 TaxID=3346123 RepID=UPI00369AA1AA
MPRPPENGKAMDVGDAAHDGYGDAEQGGPATEGPSVYHPLADAAPSYEEYADPAAAHGWQDAYDRTEELPRTSGGAAANGGARAARGRRGTRRKERPRPSRWVLVSAGAVGAVSVALVAGFSLSGSSSDGDSRGGRERTGPTEVDPAPSAEETAGGATASGAPRDGGAARTSTPGDVGPLRVGHRHRGRRALGPRGEHGPRGTDRNGDRVRDEGRTRRPPRARPRHHQGAQVAVLRRGRVRCAPGRLW